MITVAPLSTTERRAAPPRPTLRRSGVKWTERARVGLAALLAVGLHATVFFATRHAVIEQAQFGMDVSTVDVDLVAGDESASPEAVPEPVPEPPQPEPEPEPVPEPPVPEPQPMPEPEPEPMPEPPKEDTVPTPEPPKPTPPPKVSKPKPSPRAVTPRQAAPAATTTGTPGTPGGTGAGRGGKSSGPGYMHNPRPPYPPESRAAGEHGVTMVRAMLDAQGRPTSVNLLRSSGHPRLDRATLEAVRRWRFKPALKDGVPIPSSVDIPLRWNLRD